MIYHKGFYLMLMRDYCTENATPKDRCSWWVVVGLGGLIFCGGPTKGSCMRAIDKRFDDAWKARA
jgi:hypothetical protein